MIISLYNIILLLQLLHILQQRDPQRQAHTWLIDQLELEKNNNLINNKSSINIPHKPNGKEYKIEDANHQQQKIVLLVLDTLRKWVDHKSNKKLFKPLRLTIRGMAGSGKSYLLHLLSTTIRKIFGHDSVDIKVAPTGTAAFNIDGQTCHSAFGLGVSNQQKKLLSQKKRQELTFKYQRTLALFIDERSLLNSETLGGMENNASKTVHGGCHTREDWGGIPVVIAIGDDRQLPTVRVRGRGRGAFQILETNNTLHMSDNEKNGEQKFLDLAKNVVTLNQNQRVSEQNKKFRSMLERLREDNQTYDDAKIMISLDVTKHEKTIKEIENSPETLHLFAYNKDKDLLNIHRLAKVSHKDNPVAIIKSKVSSTCFSTPDKKKKKINTVKYDKSQKSHNTKFKHFRESNYPRASTICLGCKVAIKGRNFNPKWGLFNSSIGTVQEIVFEKNQNPNAGDLPLYVAVEFPSYTGPVWDITNPTVVPIPIVTGYCDKRCCQMQYLPLEIAFAKTIHTFQGMQAGPNNPIKTIIVDLGDINFESNNPGLMYTAISRALTIDEENNGKTSAIYFRNLTINHYMQSARKKLNKTPSKAMQARDMWITHLKKNELKQKFTQTQKRDLILWSQTTIPLKTLNKCISNNSWRSPV